MMQRFTCHYAPLNCPMLPIRRVAQHASILDLLQRSSGRIANQSVYVYHVLYPLICGLI